jgi:LGFP repeat
VSVIDDRYAQIGGEAGFLGKSVSDEQPTSDGKARLHIYEHGAIYWLLVDPSGSGPSTQTYEVHGAIWEHYQALGREDVYGLPLTDETAASAGPGRFNLFMNGGGIYWTPTTDAHELHGAIHAKWRALGDANPLGYPTTDESPCPDGKGRFNHFEAGSIYWTPQTDAHEVHGAIHEKWSELGWERSFLGYPTSDEGPDSYGAGTRVTHFQGGVIYWSGQTGAHEVHGAILAKWQELGAERSYLGLPTTDEEVWLSEKLNRGGRRSLFQHGEIDWTQETGAAPWPSSYTFTVDGMKILNTRSRHEDTDRASASVAVGTQPAQTVTKDLGDVNNGDYDINLSTGPVSVASNEDGVAFNYLILNAGNANWEEVNGKLHQAGNKLAEAGAKAATDAVGAAVGASIGTAVMPVIGSAIGAIAGWIAGEVVGLLTADCDGPVAVEQAGFKGQDLWDTTVDGPHVFSTIHDGVDSPAGCGSNSTYWVDWTLARA